MACARGEMFIANGVGNLQKGERCVQAKKYYPVGLHILQSSYANMDYVFASGLRHFLLNILCIIGYDIACQWFRNLLQRMQQHWPDHLKLDLKWSAIPVIGKFHEPAHEAANHEQYSCNLVRWLALTDHETMERLWGVHNVLGNSVKTMGPGTYRDTLEAHFGFHNWEKYRTMGKHWQCFCMILTLTLDRYYSLETICECGERSQ